MGGRENLISPDEQEKRARQLAKEKRLQVGKVLVDLDESGGKWERPGLQEALERVRTGKSGGLIVAWLDRLSRDSEHAHRLVRELAEAGATIYAPDAPADWTSPEGELQAGIVFTFAQYVRSRARAGFERSKEQAIARGIPVNSRAAVGYVKGDDRRLHIDPKTAPIIRELFQRRAAGAGPAALADFLESKAVKTSQGASTWSKQAVASLIKSRVYLGELSYGRDRRFVNTESHEPIVDVATWTAAQHPNGRGLQTSRTGAYSLSGLLRCQACGYSMQGTRSSAARGSKRRYRCVGRHAGGRCPNPVSVFADVVEQAAEVAFWELTKELVPEGELVARGAEVKQLEAATKVAQQRLDQALSPEVQDAAGDKWPAMVKERRADVDRAQAALGRARAEIDHVIPFPRAHELSKRWPTLTQAEKREYFAARFSAFALRRFEDGVAFLAYTIDSPPANLSRRGFVRHPVLNPLDAPADPWMIPLELGDKTPLDIAV